MSNNIDLTDTMNLSADVCAREQIHIPGAIQPHGLLIGLHAGSLVLVTKSANVDTVFPDTRLFEIPPWLPRSVIEACRDMKRSGRRECTMVSLIESVGVAEIHCFSGSGVVFCEFESMYGQPSHLLKDDTSLLVDRATREMSTALDISKLSAITARTVRSISGFERVLVYRFDIDGNGDVLGECKADGWEQSFLGLRFPASDIPAQARELYRRTSDRWVPARDYQPMPLIPSLDPGGQPFDLGLSRYRSVSPVHRLYQQNIGVDGSMSVSVMSGGALWGLVIGHHRQAHSVPVAVRHSVVGLVRCFAMRLGAILSQEVGIELERDMDGCTAMLRKLAAAEDFLSALTEGKPEILDLLPGCSGAAVVWHDRAGAAKVHALGKVPPDRDIFALTEWVRSVADGPLFSSDRLSDSFPRFKGHSKIASGVLACLFDDERRPALLLFRPELIQSVSWAGKPKKIIGPDGVPNLPRRSFDRWTEIKHYTSLPWLPWELNTLAIICSTVNDVIVRQTRRVIAHKNAEDALRRSEGLLRGIFDTSNVAIFLTDRRGRITQANEHMAEMFGYPSHALIGIEYFSLIDRQERQATEDKMLALMNGKIAKVDIERSYLRRDASRFWGQLTGTPFQDADGKNIGFVGIILDITERRKAEEQIRRMAQSDPLTGLANRALLSDRLQQAMARAKRDGSRLAALYLDLDDFKPVNDTLGHGVGDLLLKEVAQRIKKCIRASDTVARIGGDEFLVLLQPIVEETAAGQVAEKICREIRRRFAIEGHHLQISASIGIAIYPDHGLEEVKLLNNADLALYRTKREGRNNWTLFGPGCG